MVQFWIPVLRDLLDPNFQMLNRSLGDTMCTKNTPTFFAIILLSAWIIGMPVSANAQSTPSPFQLEITNIKPAGTGSPAIPSDNRIFRAYPGIEYNIRPAVIGGTFPYTFALSNAPSGMTINQNTGEISWPNPQSNSGTITLILTDSANASVQTSWVITVGTSGFVFLNASYNGTSTGSITQPYKTIEEVLNNTNSNSQIVYVRGGNYTLPSGSGEVTLDKKPLTWLGYPGETVSINGNGRYFRPYGAIYLDRLNWLNFPNGHGIILYGGHNYTTIRRCGWDYIRAPSSTNNNEGFIYATRSSGNNGYYMVIQDNSFNDFAGAQAIGSIYSTTKILIEGNTTTNGGSPGLHIFATPVGLKENNQMATIRNNRFYQPSNSVEFGIFNSDDPNAVFDISYNLIKRDGTSYGSFTIFYPDTYIYRNTFINMQIRYLTHLSSGPHYLTRNVLVNSPLYQPTYVTQSENLSGSLSDNLVDSSGNLTPAYAQYLGIRGYQITGVSSGEIKPPTGLRFQ